MTAAPVMESETDGLSVQGLSVSFGGVVAVDGFECHAPRGRITGLIGPNGAGKTTTFNACSGFVKRSAGSIYFDGRDISTLSPASRARLGLGRTFQRVELWNSFTVLENVEMGCEAGIAGGRLFSQIFGRRRDRAQVTQRAEESMRLAGVQHLAERSVTHLSSGQKRLVELARCLAGSFEILLLDEPSSGLDPTETTHFGLVLQQVVRERGLGILLVEHDMSLVMQICDYIYVLDFGKPVFAGTPQEVTTSDVVRAAYLGSTSAGVS